MDILLLDLRYALRSLVRNPLYLLAVVLALALGIGVNVSILSLINGVFLRALPYNDADRLITVRRTKRGSPGDTGPIYPAHIFSDLQQRTDLFEDLAAYVSGDNITFELSSPSDPERVRGAIVSSNLFAVLGINASLGRVFQDESGSERGMEAVISDALWRRRFKRDPNAVGRAITINGGTYTLVGVAPQQFDFPDNVDVWVPGVLYADRVLNTALTVSHSVEVIAHVKRGVTLPNAESSLNMGSNQSEPFRLIALRDHLFGRARTPLLLLWGTALFVLLIACANVASVALTRAIARSQELTVRAVVGATRGRLIRQLLTENILLASMAGACGLLLAFWLTRAVLNLSPQEFSGLVNTKFDWRLLCGAGAVSLGTGILFGIGPAIGASRPDLHQSLKEASRATTASFRQRRALRLLSAGEIALALVLLIGAGLTLRSFLRLSEMDLGYDPSGVVTMHVSLPSWRYSDLDQQSALYQRVVDRLKTTPGVRYAGWVTNLPMGRDRFKVLFQLEGRPAPSIEEMPFTYCAAVTNEYFNAIGIPLLKGRLLTEHDDKHSPLVVLIDSTMAQRFWLNEDPVGQRVQWQGKWREIVGVVGHVRSAGPDGQVTPNMYVPYSQFDFPWPSMFLVARAANDGTEIAGPLLAALREQDKELAIAGTQTAEELIARSLSRQRFSTLLLSVFAALSIALAAIGVYAVVAHSVTARMQEIGIRMSLGATRRDLLKMILRQSLAIVAWGLAAGLLASYALTRVLSNLLYGVSPRDPAVFILSSLILLIVALVASYAPARKGTSVDPLSVLRVQ